MNLAWRGQCCFEIRSKNIGIITDPYNYRKVGLKNIRPSADVATVSINDNVLAPDIVKNPKLIIANPGEYEVQDAMIWGTQSFRDKQQGKKLGLNTIYTIEIDDITICHLGHLGHTLSGKTIEELGAIDILLVPVGGGDTIGFKEAVEITNELEPKIVIPMRYKIKGIREKLDTLDKFKKELGASKVQDIDRLSIKKKDLPATETQFAILKPL